MQLLIPHHLEEVSLPSSFQRLSQVNPFVCGNTVGHQPQHGNIRKQKKEKKNTNCKAISLLTAIGTLVTYPPKILTEISGKIVKIQQQMLM